MSSSTNNSGSKPNINESSSIKKSDAALSAEEAERVASKYKPAWEVDDAASQASSAPPAPRPGVKAPAANGAKGPEVSSPAPVASPSAADLAAAADPSPQQPAPAEQPAHPPAAQAPAPVTSAPAVEAAVQDQGPVDLIADIPKRTDVQIKDEPSVVVADRESASAQTIPPAAIAPEQQKAPVDWHASDEVAAAPPAARLGADDEEVPVPAGLPRKNAKLIVGAVIGLAALVVIIAGVRALLGGTSGDAASAQPTAVQTVTAPPVVPTPAETAAAAPTQPAEPPAPEQPAPAEAREPEPPPPAKTAAPPKPPAAKTASTPPKQPPTAKPPATSKPPQPPPPPGGIVRDTPF